MYTPDRTLGPVARRSPRGPETERPQRLAELVGEDAQGLSLAELPLETVLETFAFRKVAEDGDGGLTEGPFEMGVADLGASGGPGPLAGRGLFALDEAGIGGEVLDGGEAADVVDLIEKGEGEDLADAGNAVEAEQGLEIVGAGLAKDGVLEVSDQAVIGVAEGQVGLDALAEDGILEGPGDGGTLARIGGLSEAFSGDPSGLDRPWDMSHSCGALYCPFVQRRRRGTRKGTGPHGGNTARSHFPCVLSRIHDPDSSPLAGSLKPRVIFRLCPPRITP